MADTVSLQDEIAAVRAAIRELKGLASTSDIYGDDEVRERARKRLPAMKAVRARLEGMAAPDDELEQFARDLLASQGPLGKEYAHVLHDNLDDLYVRNKEGMAAPVGGDHAISQRHFAFLNGIRRAIQWLHYRAAHDMNDPHAKAVLNTAAFHLGNALSAGEFRKPAATAEEVAAPGERARTPRQLAVDVVDGAHGYTMEFAPSPDEHKRQYDILEKGIAATLSAAVQQERDRCAWLAGDECRSRAELIAGIKEGEIPA